MPVVRYTPVDRCIYCNAASGPFFEEHIIPFALGGEHVLPAASCVKCAKITAAFEQICCRKIFGDFRIRFKFPTRRKKERPQKLKVIDLNDPRVAQAAEQALIAERRTFSVKVDPLEIPPTDHPIQLILSQFNLPRLLLGLPRAPDRYPLEQSFWGIGNHQEFAQLQSKHGQVIPYPANFHPLSFVRLLAKISHAGAIAGFGIGSFRPLLTDLILGHSKHFLDIVGGEIGSKPKVIGKYQMTFSNRNIVGNWYLVSHLRLFPELGTPQYHVVVGEIDKPISPR